MTQLIARLEDAGLVDRAADPADGRVVQVRITADGRAMLAGRRAVRAERLAGLLDRLSPDERAALAAALPAMDALANAERASKPAASPALANAQRAEPATGGPDDWSTLMSRLGREPVPAAEGRLRRRVRLRRLVHGHRAGGPDPARHLP